MKKLLLLAAILCTGVLSFADAKADYANAEKLVKENKTSEAVKVLEKIAASGEKDYATKANFDLGIYYFQTKNNAKAKTHLSAVWNKGAEVTPETIEAAKWLHSIASSEKKISEAEGYIDWLDKKTEGKDSDIVSNMIIFYFENNLQQKGQARYNTASKSTDKEFVAEVNYNLGQYYIEKNDLTKAKKYLQDAYKQTPNAIVPAGFLLSQIALAENDSKSAEKYLLEMNTQTQNKNSRILTMLGSYYIEANDLVKSEDYLKKAVAADSKNGEALFMLLAIYESKNDTANINSTYNKLKAIVPKGLNKELGVVYASTGNAGLSEKYLKKSINEDKDNEAKMYLGQLYFFTGKQNEGINLVKEAVKLKVKGSEEVLKELENIMKQPAATTPKK